LPDADANPDAVLELPDADANPDAVLELSDADADAHRAVRAADSDADRGHAHSDPDGGPHSDPDRAVHAADSHAAPSLERATVGSHVLLRQPAHPLSELRTAIDAQADRHHPQLQPLTRTSSS
jgi:hypothetical protein